jgi:cAMP-specific phosphodiesterase 4
MQETNFLAQLSEKNQKLVKRRILGVIMATDME